MNCPQGAIEAHGAVLNVRSRPDLSHKSRFSLKLYRSGNAIERLLCRLKDFKRVATSYGRLAATCLAAVRDRRSTEGHIAAIVHSGCESGA